MTAVRWLDDLGAYRLSELPRPPAVAAGWEERDPGRAQRIAALAATYHGFPEGTVIALSWRRLAAGGPIDLITAGDVLGSRGADGTPVLRLPPGGRAAALGPGGLATALAAVPAWTRLTMVTDGLLAEMDQPWEPGRTSTLADSFLTVWREEFAWLVLAVAVPPAEVAALAADTGAAAREAQSRAGGSPEYRLRLDRLDRQLRELRRGESTGLWSVHLLAGGADDRAARGVAAVLAAAADLSGTPYAIVPSGQTGDLDKVLYGQSPFVAGSAALAALWEPPRAEVPGLRLRLRADFDVTPEPVTGPAIRLGTVLDADATPVGPFAVPTDSLVRHVFVAGATGGGKSQTVRALLEQATTLDLPWLVVEPSKAEYRSMSARLPGVPVIAIRPGDVSAVPAGLNPLEPAPGFPLQTHVDLVRALFIAAFEADEPFPQVLGAALTRCYHEQGWHLALGRAQPGARSPRYPTLGDLQRTAEAVVADIGYGREVTDNVRGFIRVRLSSLRLGTTGRFFEGGHPIDVDALLRSRVVFEIEDVGDDRDKAFLMGTVLIRLVEHLRVRHRHAPPGPQPLRHLAVFEEAHRLLRKQEGRGPAAHAIELFAALLAEIRVYGEGIVVADQIPSKLVPDVIKNTAVKILHRLPARDDRDVVGATINLTDAQSTYLVTLPPGTAAAFADGMDYPLLVAMPDGTAREAASPVTPADPTSLVGRRSRTCGPDCHRRPCTLTDIESARHALHRSGEWLALWAELGVLAHLVGHASPQPVEALLDDVRSLNSRRRDCAIGQAADDAVASRSSTVVRRAPPAALAAHVAEMMRHVVAGRAPCRPEARWLAEPFRWALVRDGLTRLVQASPDAPRHPRSAEWAVRYGRPIPGETAAAQLDAVTRWYQAGGRDVAARQVVVFGVARPSTLERLRPGLDQFVGAEWVTRYV